MTDKNMKTFFGKAANESIEVLESLSREKVKQFIREAAVDTDELFGSGSSDQHPGVVAAMAQMRSQQLQTFCLKKAIDDAATDICTEISSLEGAVDRIS